MYIYIYYTPKITYRFFLIDYLPSGSCRCQTQPGQRTQNGNATAEHRLGSILAHRRWGKKHTNMRLGKFVLGVICILIVQL